MERVGRRQDSTGARLPTTHFILLSFELDELIQKTQNKNKKQNLKQYPCSFMSPSHERKSSAVARSRGLVSNMSGSNPMPPLFDFLTEESHVFFESQFSPYNLGITVLKVTLLDAYCDDVCNVINMVL